MTKPGARVVAVFGVVAVWIGVSGCRRPPAYDPNTATTGESPAEATTAANEIFSTRCMPCHGITGMGDGPASAALTPRPRNFHDRSWQASVVDSHIERIIQFGGTAVGKSASMPPNPDLIERPAVVTALRMHVRSLAQ